MFIDTGKSAFAELAASALSPAGIEQFRIERLVELRAVIDSLRSERTSELLEDVQRERERICRR